VIPDPYGGPDEGYEATVTQVLAAAEGLIETLRSARLQDSVAYD
jgi:protein-tyrosine-phosphatase